MTSVEINAGGRYVKVQQDGRDAETLMPLVQKAWQETEGAKHPSEGAAFGFSDDKRWTPDADPLSPGGYGGGYSAPVKAGGDNAHSLRGPEQEEGHDVGRADRQRREGQEPGR